ncbi:hypothetical protein GN244_ATG12190 [Phytophthora infestans]|uniref:Uncharacterized protein n=1 Tax=Phytophthora infestans TaxID=4787 RepID=A0A833WSS5_PHYIN|nr:hypothetical protein GN244_ATG12190 [Phytophthora infestans]
MATTTDIEAATETMVTRTPGDKDDDDSGLVAATRADAVLDEQVTPTAETHELETWTARADEHVTAVAKNEDVVVAVTAVDSATGARQPVRAATGGTQRLAETQQSEAPGRDAEDVTAADAGATRPEPVGRQLTGGGVAARSATEPTTVRTKEGERQLDGHEELNDAEEARLHEGVVSRLPAIAATRGANGAARRAGEADSGGGLAVRPKRHHVRLQLTADQERAAAAKSSSDTEEPVFPIRGPDGVQSAQ